MEWICLDRVDSTNRYAKELARQGAPAGTAILARSQTGGRGRLGRAFYSPEGGVYLSLILRPCLRPEELSLITPLAALSVCKTLERRFGLRPAIQWVNDVYLDGKKICGILCETAGGGVIVGVGLNYLWPPEGFSPALNAGALFSPEAAPLPVEALAGALATDILREAEVLPDVAFLEEYRKRELLHSGEVTVYPVSDAPYTARALAIDDRGRLVIETKDGPQPLDSGRVSVKL